MNTSESLEALRRANPRGRAGFARSVETAAEAVRAQLVTTAQPVAVAGRPRQRRIRHAHPRRRLLGVSAAGASIAAAAAAVAFLAVGSPGSGPGVENAAAAVKQAATVTAALAEVSGTAVVRITHDGELWAGKTVRWNGSDVAIVEDTPGREGRPAGEVLVVDGTLYWVEPEVGWVASNPDAIDPDSGQTPSEDLTAVREDVGGETVGRISSGIADPVTVQLEDGSTVYRGSVPARLIARETGFKEGQAIRAFPFGYVAHDAAADPAALLDTAITVGADGMVREIAVTWGTDVSTWTYTVTYSNLGTTSAPVAPENARSVEEWRASALRTSRGN
jgi:hypothetical protein